MSTIDPREDFLGLGIQVVFILVILQPYRRPTQFDRRRKHTDGILALKYFSLGVIHIISAYSKLARNRHMAPSKGAENNPCRGWGERTTPGYSLTNNCHCHG